MLVLIVDDHPLLRQAIREVMESHLPSAVIREASTGEEGLQIIRAEHVEMAIVGISLPDRSGLTLLKRIRRIRPTTKCLVLSMHEEPQYARLAIMHGAAGYLTKGATANELREAMRAVLSGCQVVMERFEDQLKPPLKQPNAQRPHESLSVRELEVLSLLAKGRIASQAATCLALSVKIVSTYQSRLLQKLCLRTTADLIRYAVEHHVV